MANTIRSGAITGNPLVGLCQRACIRTERVFDGCISRFSNVELTVSLEGFTATSSAYTFVGLRSSGQATIGEQTSSQIDGSKNRIVLSISTPITVYYVTADGASGSASGVIKTNRDVILSVPPDSIVPYSVDVTSSITGSVGEFASDLTSVSVRCCILQIIRIVAPVDILVPSYGYCVYPECESYAERECRESFSMPIFPDA